MDVKLVLIVLVPCVALLALFIGYMGHKLAIARTMAEYPAGWRWNNDMELGKMLLPLAWLVRLQDTPEHDKLWFEQKPPRDFDFEG